MCSLLRRHLSARTRLCYCCRTFSSECSSNDACTENGVINDKKPATVCLEAGKTYYWCTCGRSKKQPFCDGTHEKKELKIKQKPVEFKVNESKEYNLCKCKQTRKRPFCDGTHMCPHVQQACSVVEQEKKC